MASARATGTIRYATGAEATGTWENGELTEGTTSSGAVVTTEDAAETPDTQ